MREMRKLPVLAAGLAVVCLCTAKAEPVDPDPFQQPDKAPAIVRIGGGSYLGVNLREIDAERAKELKLREEAGVEITRVEDDSPAAKAGIKAGDVVLSYNGQRVEGMEQFSRFVRETPPGREVKLSISRDGNTQTLAAKLGSRKAPMAMALPRVEIPAVAPMPPMPPMPDLPRGLMMWRTSTLGIEAESLKGQMAEFFGVKEGVLVRSVMKDTPAAKAGIKAGDVILKVDDTKIAAPSDISSAIHSAQNKKTFTITLMRDHKEMTVTATIDPEERGEWNLPRVRQINGSIRM
jgi:serine protease Do